MESAKYVVIKKARGPKGIYREVYSDPLDFDEAKGLASDFNISEMTDTVIEFYVTPDPGKKLFDIL